MFQLALTLAWLRERPREMFIAAMLALLVAVTLAPADVFAADTAIVVEDNSGIVLTPVQVTILTGLVMPFVLGLVNRFIANASSRTKGFVGIIAAAVAAFVARSVMVDGSALFTWALLLDIGLVYGPQLATYVGIWSKPTKDGQNLNDRIASIGTT